MVSRSKASVLYPDGQTCSAPPQYSPGRCARRHRQQDSISSPWMLLPQADRECRKDFACSAPRDSSVFGEETSGQPGSLKLRFVIPLQRTRMSFTVTSSSSPVERCWSRTSSPSEGWRTSWFFRALGAWGDPQSAWPSPECWRLKVAVPDSPSRAQPTAQSPSPNLSHDESAGRGTVGKLFAEFTFPVTEDPGMVVVSFSPNQTIVHDENVRLPRLAAFFGQCYLPSFIDFEFCLAYQEL